MMMVKDFYLYTLICNILLTLVISFIILGFVYGIIFCLKKIIYRIKNEIQWWNIRRKQ
ncbi:MAG: hypothetical protein NC833_03330 [Candidatus Omnitrophica bacterium]|nr:hypothetical protein [Candidatus Omnitrophota bacterium]